MPGIDFQDHLRRQLRFIERSSDSFDRGSFDEAIRIATVLRVIFHNSGKSVSLLKHLNANVRILTQIQSLPKKATFADATTLIVMGPQGSGLQPRLGKGHYKAFLPEGAWWKQLVYVRGELKIKRCDIVLAAANKDGGAHVDAELTAEYEELKRGVWTISSGTEGERPIGDQQFILLRDAAYEVLHSPDILSLVNN